jgi:hypothetical protein
MRSRVRLFVLALVAVACGNSTATGPQKTGGSGGGGVGGNGVPNVPAGTEPIESFEADKIAAQCSANVRCNQVASVDGCVAATLPILSPQLVPDVQSGVISYDPHLGYRCIQLILAEPCTGGADLESCHDAFTGTLLGGATCAMNAECQSDACSMTCAGSNTTCCPPGTCLAGVEPRNVAVGAKCTSGVCGEGEFCDTTADICRARLGEGESCKAGICQQGLVCSNVSATCVEPSSLGGTCSGDFCDGQAALCSTNAICTAAPQVGDPCTGDFCDVALNCVNGACVVPGVIGQPCVGDQGSTQCQNGIMSLGNEEVACVSGLCAQRYAPPTEIACLSP